MATKKSVQSHHGDQPRLERTEATVEALGRIWLACPPPLKTAVWTITFVLIAGVLRAAELVGIDPFSGASGFLMDFIERAGML